VRREFPFAGKSASPACPEAIRLTLPLSSATLCCRLTGGGPVAAGPLDCCEPTEQLLAIRFRWSVMPALQTKSLYVSLTAHGVSTLGTRSVTRLKYIVHAPATRARSREISWIMILPGHRVIGSIFSAQ
jgi:hypothetical protein